MAHETRITPTDNGPLHVQGSFSVVLPSGRELESDGEAWLCRCGRSESKPFCDGTHERIGFVAAGPIAQSQSAAADDTFEDVGAAADVAEGELIGATLDGQPVVIGRVEGWLYAMGGLCSHGQASLEGGVLDGPLLVCPRHGGAFDIRSGAAARLPVRLPVPRYAVKVEAGRLLVARTPTADLVKAR